jgi:spore maturation protein CgeB
MTTSARTRPLRIAFFGSSLVSAYWNGAATYYRGLLRALAQRGHRVTFFEPDAFDRQQHRDMAPPAWASVEVYPASEDGVRGALARAWAADLVVKASGVGVFDDLLEAEVLTLKTSRRLVAFWDVDAPATLERLDANPRDPFRWHIPRYDAVFTYGGGDPVVNAYLRLGARRCQPIYNALDPDVHGPETARPRFACDLAFLGNRLPDREARVEEFFLSVARRLPERRFLLGGNGWNVESLPPNVTYVGHVYTADHNALNASALAVLNIHRDSMARYGHSPATRIFEAGGAGSCVISDACAGLTGFLTPGEEILLARDGAEVERHLVALSPVRAAEIGSRARAKLLERHTYAHRAAQVDEVLAQLTRRLEPAPE